MTTARRSLVAGSALCSLLAAGFAWNALTAQPPSRGDQWKKVRDAQAKGLPQTAIKELEPVIASAIADKAYPEAVKAVALKIALEGAVQGNKPEEKVTRMAAEIAKAPAPMKPAMEAILAHWYWHYFQQNRWRFLQRTATAAPPGADFTTWDLPRILAEIDKHFTAALAAEKELKAIPAADWDELFVKGTLADKYRPTAYDLLAFEALTFYTAPEQAGAKGEDDFELTADGPALGTTEEFLAWNPPADAASRTRRAVSLFQEVLRFHLPDPDRTAFLDADLHRLRFAHATAVGEGKAARYKAALTAFADRFSTHELSAVARVWLAEVLRGEEDYLAAKAAAKAAADAFPDSYGGKMAVNLIREIEAPGLDLFTEQVWADAKPVVRVRYRNLTTVHLRFYRTDWAARLGQNQRPEIHSDWRPMLAGKPDAATTATLPATPDHKTRTEDVAIDRPPHGFYFVFASPDAGFDKAAGPVSTTSVWVSDLAIVTRHEDGTARLAGLVANARTGEPVAGAAVQIWLRDDRGRWAAGPAAATDANGLYSVPVQSGRTWRVLVAHGGQQLAAGQELFPYDQSRQSGVRHATVLFTDRSLYRPGQPIRYKGICLKADTGTDKYEVLADHSAEIVFMDVNRKEVARQAVRTNGYGSFSGTFTAPRDRLTGRMSLQMLGTAPGAVAVTVEEYKRPQFLVTLDAPADPAKLGGPVTLAGKATAYTGAAVGGAKVRFRVVREVRYPPWFGEYYWWRMPTPRPAQQVASGTATTEADGSFRITFPAIPDKSIPEKDEPVFRFTVTADVTDTTGETRSADRSVQVGYSALQAEVTADEWQSVGQPVKLTVATKSHDGEPRPATGTVTVFKLIPPDAVQRPDLLGPGQPVPLPRRGVRPGQPSPDASNPKTWEPGEAVAKLPFTTDASGTVTLSVPLPAGAYRAVLETADRFGKAVSGRRQLTVIDPGAATFPIRQPHFLASAKWSYEPGQDFVAVWGTGYPAGRAFVEVEHRGKLLQAYWSDTNRTQVPIKQPVTEAMRGGFTLRVTFVHENRAYLESRHVDVPWTNKQLTVKWERFTSKLEPGKKETWTAVITGPDAKRAAAEVVAAAYDKSLDAFLPHSWPDRFNVFRRDYTRVRLGFENHAQGFRPVVGSWPMKILPIVQQTYRTLPPDIAATVWGYGGMQASDVSMALGRAEGAAPGAALGADGTGQFATERLMAKNGATEYFAAGLGGDGGGKPSAPAPNLDQVAARSNLAETAFFFPHLVAGDDGTVRIEFTMPEALTTWKVLAFAHDEQLRGGLLTGEAVTAKDLMVRPNPPRFLRDGDVIEFTVKVSNQSPTRQSGTVRLTFADARTGEPVDAKLGNATAEQRFDIAGKESQTASWRITVPDGLGPITYKAVAASESFSDGEDGLLPVLSRRVLVTESMPLPIRGPGTKQFDFVKLRESAGSGTLKHQSLTVEMTSNPAWYAVLALPYLMEFPHECSEQTFNRLYANALARHVAASDPKVRRVFDQWKNTPALDSPLTKNQDVKAVLLEETPWVRAADKESEARRNVGVLFDDNRLADELGRAARKLAEMQHADGAWPWFPGGPANDYITLYIATGFGRMRHLGVKADIAPAVKAWPRLDAWVTDIYTRIEKKDENHLSPLIALYLYGRSFFLADVPVAAQHKTAVDYWLNQARAHWLKLANRQSQGHLALALHRFGDKQAALGIMASIKERSVTNEEMGRFWRDAELSWWWYRAPIETQALMIEAFAEVADDRAAVEECKVWLLKQKQTQNWRTTKATADAVYALLLRGDNLLSSDALVTVALGGVKVEPEKVEAGTGYYEEKFTRGEVKPTMAAITVTKADPGVAWGAVHWQYLEDISKVTPHAGTPLTLEKKLFKRTVTKKGPVLEPVAGPVAVGDEIVVRVVLRTDWDMEYVHLRDHRGSGTEPVNVLSRYRFQDGLAYYESTKDTASHFFIDYLPKGTYVFEYPVRVQLRGQYPTGMANVQCMYAPEFNSHSESIMLEVK